MAFTKPSAMLTDAFGTLFVRMIGIALIFLSTTLTARILGPAEYGTYSAAMALALLLATLAPLGTDRILVQNLSNTKCPTEIGHETAITHIAAAWSVAILFIGLIAAWLLCANVLHNENWARASSLAAMLFIPMTAIYLRQWLAIPLIGTRRAVLPEQTLLPVIFTTALLVCVTMKLPLNASTTAIGYSLITALVWFLSLRSVSLRTAYLKALKSAPVIGKTIVVRRMIDGLAYVAVAVGAIITQSCMPLTIAATCGFTETAFYTLAMPFGALPAIPLGVFNLTMFSRCAKLYRNDQMAEANHTVRSAATMTFGLSVGIAVSIWMLSPLLITILGIEYATVCRLLPALLLAAMIDSLTGPTIPVMQTMKMEKNYSHLLMASIPIQLGIIFLFGTVASIEGAALGYLLSRILWNIVIVIRIRQLRGLVMLPYLQFLIAWREFHELPQSHSVLSQSTADQSAPGHHTTALERQAA